MTTALVFENVCLTAGGRSILRDCSFRVASGSFTGILGPNGAGKSTLLKLCNALALPSAGTVTCLGRTVNAASARQLRRRIGYVSQFRSLEPGVPITVFESVLSGTYGKLGFFRRPGKKERAGAAAALEAVSAAHLAARPLGHLSGGEAQRVAVARALAQKPEILLLDEPTASLDWQARREVLQLVAKLKQSTTLTILMVTHELNAVPELCDAVVYVKDGLARAQASVETALSAACLSDLYDTPVEVLRHGGRPVVLM